MPSTIVFNGTDKKFYLWLLFFLLVIILRCISIPTAYIGFILVLIYSLFSIENILKALLMSWFLVLINPALAPDFPATSLFRNLIILVSFFSLCIHSKKINFGKIEPINFSLCFILIVLSFHSVLFSQYPILSLLKLFSWFLTLFVCICCWNNLGSRSEKVFLQLTKGLLFLFFISLPLIFIHSVGFLRNDTGFQGVFNHPQVFGPTSALLGVILFSQIAWSPNQKYMNYIIILLIFIMIILSQARTAGLAMILSILFTILIWYFSNKKMLFIKSKKFFFSLSFALFALILTFPLIGPFISNYIFKRNEASNLVDAAQASRGGLVDDMLLNINNFPWTGIGFGVGSDMSSVELVTDSIFGLPLSAAIEKGVLPIAVIEELGFLVGGIMYLWFFYLFKQSYKNYKTLPLFFVVILTNLGEFTFFSAGGLGLLFIITLGYSVAARNKNYAAF